MIHRDLPTIRGEGEEGEDVPRLCPVPSDLVAILQCRHGTATVASSFREREDVCVSSLQCGQVGMDTGPEVGCLEVLEVEVGDVWGEDLSLL